MTPMPTARKYARTAVLDGTLYAVGGMSEADISTSNLVERYSMKWPRSRGSLWRQSNGDTT